MLASAASIEQVQGTILLGAGGRENRFMSGGRHSGEKDGGGELWVLQKEVKLLLLTVQGEQGCWRRPQSLRLYR